MLLITLLGLSGLLLLLIVAIGASLSAPRYKGPESDHFDGKRFLNPGGIKAKGLGEVLKWAARRQRGPWQEIQAAPGPPPPMRVSGDEFRITFVNHATFLIQVAGLNILTDPVWSKRVSPLSWAGPKRMRPPGIRLEDLPPIDLILQSHNHYDHLDLPILRRITREHQPAIYTCLGVSQFLTQKGIRNSKDMDWWDELPHNDELRIQCVPAQHFSARGMFDRDATLWGGFVLKTAKGHLYFCGDSGYGDFFREIGARSGPFRLALIPIGAYLPRWFMSPIHVDPDQAVQIHLDVQAQTSVAMHYGTFPLADDGMTEAVEDLQKALKQRNMPPTDFLVLEEGLGKTFRF